MSLTLGSALDRFYHWEGLKPDAMMLNQARDGRWKRLSWSEVGKEARDIALALNFFGVQPGDRVALLAKNCAHWIIADLAIMMSGAVSVPLFPSVDPSTLEYILKHSGSRVLITGAVEHPERLAACIPLSIQTLQLPFFDVWPRGCSWETARTLGQRRDQQSKDYRPSLDTLATIIYTSGTTGFPKAVMHSFRTIAAATEGFKNHFGYNESDRLFSYLPLSHVAERALVEMTALYSGCTISFAESLESFAQNLQDVAPTSFFSVPRLWSRFQAGVHEQIPEAKLRVLLRIPLLSRIVKKKIRLRFGLHKAKRIGSGAAPIRADLLTWFQKLDIEITEGFGQTENFGYGTVNPKGAIRIGSVGKVLPENDLLIAENGEVLIKSPASMLGYYMDQDATDETFWNGYIRTGDLGFLDQDGYLFITGRIKEIFKTDRGKYVAPAPIEKRFLMESTYVEQLCVIGQSLPQPVALCVLTAAAKSRSKPDLQKHFNAAMDRTNQSLQRHERIERCIVLDEDWTIETGLMTPTLKIKRHNIEAKYRDMVSAAQLRPETVVWADSLL